MNRTQVASYSLFGYCTKSFLFRQLQPLYFFNYQGTFHDLLHQSSSLPSVKKENREQLYNRAAYRDFALYENDSVKYR